MMEKVRLALKKLHLTLQKKRGLQHGCDSCNMRVKMGRAKTSTHRQNLPFLRALQNTALLGIIMGQCALLGTSSIIISTKNIPDRGDTADAWLIRNVVMNHYICLVLITLTAEKQMKSMLMTKIIDLGGIFIYITNAQGVMGIQ